MRSSWITQVDPKFNDKCPCKRQKRDTDTEEEAQIRVRQPHAKEHQGLPATPGSHSLHPTVCSHPCGVPWAPGFTFRPHLGHLSWAPLTSLSPRPAAHPISPLCSSSRGVAMQLLPVPARLTSLLDPTVGHSVPACVNAWERWSPFWQLLTKGPWYRHCHHFIKLFGSHPWPRAAASDPTVRLT